MKDFANSLYCGDMYHIAGIVLGKNCNRNKDFIDRAKNNVYITGRLPGYKGEGNNVGNIQKSIFNNPIGKLRIKSFKESFIEVNQNYHLIIKQSVIN
jgi:hypothetical protein